ncbi:unnamed protein product [Adineta ricciae]|nr:unnamed protein product [Adineta ricciae]
MQSPFIWAKIEPNINLTAIEYSLAIRNAFVYTKGKQPDTYLYMGTHATYGSGGYVYEIRGRLSDIRSNLSTLHHLEWIDAKTRAVLIQSTSKVIIFDYSN